MIVLSTATPDRFTPAHYNGQADAPVYLIEPATLRRRAQYYAALTAAGVRLPPQGEMFEALRRGAKEIVAENELAIALDLIDRLETQQTAPAEKLKEDQKNALKLTADDLARLNLLTDALRQAKFLPFTRWEAAQNYWYEMSPLIAADMFLVGWEHVTAPFPQKSGAGASITEGMLEAVIPARDIHAIGWRAIHLMNLDNEAKKNWGSPAPSSASH